MTSIQELFVRPIDRNINGVIKVGQQDEANVTQELDEYVVTRELDKHFNTFFSKYADSLGSETDRVGVWISGFFGSGKSHFMKILSYLLTNRNVAGRPAVSFFDEEKIPDAFLRASIERVARAAEHTDVILFNIDNKADAESKTSKEAVVRVIFKAFDEHLGYLASSPEMAAFERMLDKRGSYGEFKAAFERRSGRSWEQERDGWAFFQGEITAALNDAAGLSEVEGTRLLESLNVKRGASPEEFAKEVREYLDRQGPQRRIVFMIDEVGQYIGDNSSLMLNLQAVTEELGTQAPGRAWILVTSQEDMDNVLSGRGKNNDFSKIQGRFNTRISLAGANVAEVIRLRLLNKTVDGERALKALFDTQQATLRNLISFSSDNAALPGFADAETFVATYPFVPYQFLLLQKAFTAIRTMGHSGKHLAEGERSMLNAFQDAANQHGGQLLGSLVPFHSFYGPVEGFLDSAVRRVVDQAKDNPGLQPSDIDLLKTLFMIKHVKEIRPNLENLITLELSHVDEDKLALRERLQGALERLEKQTLIARNGDTYTFLTHEEQDVGREIKNVDVDTGELNSELQNRIWNGVYHLSTLKYDSYHSYTFNRKLDDRQFGAATADIGLHILTPYADRYNELLQEQNALLASGSGTEALVILPDDTLLFAELVEMVRTEKYLSRRAGGDTSASMKTILQARAEENSHRKSRIETNLRQAIVDARVYANGARQPSGASDPREVLTGALRTLVANGYQKLGDIQKPHLTELDVARAFVTVDESQNLDGQDPNHRALSEMERWLNEQAMRNLRVTVRVVLDQFMRRPYGWSDAETLGILATLVAKGTAELRRTQSIVDPGEKGLAGKLLKKAGQEETVVRLSEAINPVALSTARKLAQEYLTGMQKASTMEAPRLTADFREQLQQDRQELGRYQERAAQGYPFGRNLVEPLELIERLLQTEGSSAFLALLHQEREPFEDWLELRSKLQGFYKGNQVGIFEQLQRSLKELAADLTRVNVPELQERVSKVRRMLEMNDPTSEIPKLSGVLKPVQAHIEELLSVAKDKVEAVLQGEISRLKAIALELGPEETRQLTGPILAVKDRLALAKTIDAAEAAELHVQQSSQQVEQAIVKRINELAQKVDPVERIDRVDPLPPTKPIRSLEVRSLMTKTYLESTPDIEAFLGQLRRDLEAAVNAGERVQIK